MNEHRTYLKPQSFQTVASIAQLEHQLTVRTPDLSANESSCWGDWGPMHTINLKAGQTIDIAYRALPDGDEQQVKLQPKSVSLCSPMIADVRKQFPYYLEIADPERGLRINAFLKPNGEFAHAHVEQLYAGVQDMLRDVA